MKHTRLLAATAIVALMASGATALTVEVNTIAGDWQNPVGGAFGTDIANGDPTSSIRWPEDDSGNQSGYDFTRVAIPFDAAPSSPFLVGTFTHINEPVTIGSGIDTVELQLTFGGNIEGTPFSLSPTYLFDHFETPNRTPCAVLPNPHTTVCDDLVSFALADGSTTTTVTKGLERYTFSLIGFSTDGGATITSSFQSPEGGSNSAGLYARYDITVIPLPAAAWLLLGGLGALGLTGYRRRKTA